MGTSLEDEVWAISDVAKAAGVSTQAVHQWIKRYEDFPPSIGRIAGRKVFSKSKAEDWLKQNGKVA